MIDYVYIRILKKKISKRCNDSFGRSCHSASYTERISPAKSKYRLHRHRQSWLGCDPGIGSNRSYQRCSTLRCRHGSTPYAKCIKEISECTPLPGFQATI